MEKERRNADKVLYRQLRTMTCDALWQDAVARFDGSSPAARMEQVSVVRAVGAAFAESGTAAQKIAARAWLVTLLQDPAEKIRRYAMNALPKLGAGPAEEAVLLALLKASTLDREKKHLSETLDKIGGPATLAALRESGAAPLQTEQKVRARVARNEQPSVIRLESVLTDFKQLRIHLRCRKGLETIVRDEVISRIGANGKFRLGTISGGLVVLIPLAPFALADVFTLRCFSTLNLVLGTAHMAPPADFHAALATTITGPRARAILTALTQGPIRYRLDFIAASHQRGAVRQVTNRAYALCPDMLNDARLAPWSIDLHPTGSGVSVELRPRISPDPRFAYREDDVPAASHPPLAASMARLAGRVRDETIWDPFCGSGLELIECALLGGVQRVIGTDLSPTAVAIAQTNFAAAKLRSDLATFACCDFREHAKVPGLGPRSVSLIITNPPMGRRVRIPDMQGLFASFFAVAATVLKPGGRLVFANPLRLESPSPALSLHSRQVIDLGGFDCRLEVYRKQA